MYLTAKPGNFTWDGDPLTFEPTVGDTFACEVFSKSQLFNNTGNNFFCLVEEEKQLMTDFLKKNHLWDTYTYGKV